MSQLLATTQQALETARYTSSTLRSMVDVYVEAENVIRDPNQVFEASKVAFSKTFPELQAIANDAEAMRRPLHRLPGPRRHRRRIS